MTSSHFKQYFDTLYLPLCLFALRHLGNREEAEEVVQSAFSAVWERCREGLEISSFKSYIFGVVRNGCLNRLRGMRREECMSEDIECAAEVPVEEIDTAERDARLWKAIGELPDKCRKVFLMCKRDGLSYREVAAEMSISEKTVENQMSKALSRLRESLGPKGRKVFFLPFL